MSIAAESRPGEPLKDRLGRFFYAQEVPYGLAVVRMLLPLVLLYPMLIRWPHVREYFSTDGATTPLWILYGYASMLPEFPGSVAVGLYTAMLFCFVTASLGFLTRASLIAACVLYTYFNLVDAISTMTKYSVIAAHVLLLLSLSQCGAVWSLDAWRARRRERPGHWPGGPRFEPPRSPAWPRRLVQLMIATVYFGAAVTKMHTPAYFSGDQLRYWMISDINYHNLLGAYFAMYPAVVAVGCYVTAVWEMLFIVLAWRGLGRRIMLSVGVLFHLMTFLTLGLRVFPLTCTVIYFAFLNEDDVRWLAAGFRRRLRRWGFGRGGRAAERRPVLAIPEFLRLPAPAVFALAGSLAVCLGLVLEHRLDLYGERRPEGPYPLREVDPGLVRTMLAPSRPIQLSDKIFSFDVGSLRIGGTLARRRSEFRAGEHLTAEVLMNPPFEDMWAECFLHDAANRPVTCIGQMVLSRESLRGHFCTTLPTSLEPGRYWVVLSCAGREVERRPIVIHAPRRSAPLAN